MIVSYTIFASLESAKLSSKTIDEAFERFKNEYVQTEIDYKAYYQIGNSTFVPFEVGNYVSLVQFEKGIFGWKPTYYSHDEEDASYSSFVDGDILLHGVVPKDIVAETKTIKVNGIEADIVRLNDQTSVWILMNNTPKNFSNINIDFLNIDGHIISEI